MNDPDQEPRAKGPAAALARMPTGAKVFLILVGALLPLALIALFTTIQTTRTADTEARAAAGAIADESSGVVENVLTNHVGQMSEALAALEQATRTTRQLHPAGRHLRRARRRAFRDRRRQRRVLCGQRFTLPGDDAVRPREDSATIARRRPGDPHRRQRRA
jgi:hypothetical protein